MTGLLLDTSIVSELRRPSRNVGFSKWWEGVESSRLHLSVLTLGELRLGVERLRHRDEPRAEAIAAWGAELYEGFRSRILPVDHASAVHWGSISADRTRPVIDTLIAATAIAHDMTLVTRNVRDFEDLPVRLLNPFL